MELIQKISARIPLRIHVSSTLGGRYSSCSIQDDTSYPVNPDIPEHERTDSGAGRVTADQNTSYVDSTESCRLFDWLIMTYYVPLEIWYTRTSIDKVLSPFCFFFSLILFAITGPSSIKYRYLTTTPSDHYTR